MGAGGGGGGALRGTASSPQPPLCALPWPEEGSAGRRGSLPGPAPEGLSRRGAEADDTGPRLEAFPFLPPSRVPPWGLCGELRRGGCGGSVVTVSGGGSRVRPQRPVKQVGPQSPQPPGRLAPALRA